MATFNKDFKIKSGLIVEGTSATVNGNQVLTENASDQYILDLIGGETLIKSVSNEFDVSVAGELSIDRATVDAYYDAAGDAADALTDANSYTDSGLALKQDILIPGSGLAVTGANITVNPAEMVNKVITGVSGASYGLVGTSEYLDVKDTNGYNKEIELDIAAVESKLTTDGFASQTDISDAITALDLANTYDAKGTAAALIDDASNLSTEVWSAYKTSTEIGLAQQAAEDYTDTAVGNIVGAAPELLDTLQELATALQDNPDIISDLQDIASGKQDTLTAGSNIDITGSTISVTGLSAENISDFNTAALSATASAYDASGAAATAQSNAEDYADGLAVNYDAAGSATSAAATALQDAKDYADALDTDDVAEGTNQYFTDYRAKVSAVDLLTNATKSNIEITWSNPTGLVITAENGVAGSTTDDLTEGSTNLYFTDQRAIDAIDTVSITPGAVTINNWRKEESEQVYVANVSTVNVHSFDYPYESVKYLVRVVGMDGGVKHSQITEILMTVDGNHNIAMTEYGNVHTSTDPLASFSAAYSGGVYNLTATTAVSGCEIIVAATMLSWAD